MRLSKYLKTQLIDRKKKWPKILIQCENWSMIRFKRKATMKWKNGKKIQVLVGIFHAKTFFFVWKLEKDGMRDFITISIVLIHPKMLFRPERQQIYTKYAKSRNYWNHQNTHVFTKKKKIKKILHPILLFSMEIWPLMRF